MISTILFTKIAFAQYDCKAIHDENTCLNDPYETCAWFGQCATTVQSDCYYKRNSWDCGIVQGCSWDLTQNKCTQDGCGYHECRSDCNGIPGCGWEEYCDYNNDATKPKANGPCYRRLDEEAGEELEAPTEELEAPSFGDWLSNLIGIDTYTHRRAEYSVEDEEAAFIPDGQVQSDDDAETEDTEDNESEDTEDTEDTEDRRRHSVSDNDNYCSKYYNQGQCDVDSVCAWHTLYGHWNNGLCKGKKVTGCTVYGMTDCAFHVGNTGQPCQWVGPMHGPGSCVETAAPAPSPTPSNTCGMWFSESSCPSNCHWNALQNRCEVGGGIPPPNTCGMWFSESTCPRFNCHWNARQNRCESGAAPAPTPSPDSCGMFFAQSSCPSNCEWHYWEQKCVAKPQANCSSYSDWSHCAFAEGCKWNIIQDICSPKGTRDIFCDTLMSYSWCNKFQSSGCYWSAHHNQCLAH